MGRIAKWSGVLGLLGAAAFAAPAVSAFARGGGPQGGGAPPGGGSGSGGSKAPEGPSAGGGSGSGGGSEGKSAGGSGGSSGGGGAKTGTTGASPTKKNNTSTTKGRGDYLALFQREEADAQRASFLDNAATESLRIVRAASRAQ